MHGPRGAYVLVPKVGSTKAVPDCDKNCEGKKTGRGGLDYEPVGFGGARLSDGWLGNLSPPGGGGGRSDEREPALKGPGQSR